MPYSTLSTKGQLVVPKEVRDFLRLRPGDRIDFVVRDDGQVSIRPAVVDVHSLRGMLHRPGRAVVSVEQMKQAVRARVG
jgi:AbrB family looped-hinge helix DNA binding protein